MRPTDEQLRTLVVCGDQEARKELADRVTWQAMRAIPNRKGVCFAGRRVVMDERGAMSSGYLLHDERGYPVCSHGVDSWDEPDERTRYLQSIIDWCRQFT